MPIKIFFITYGCTYNQADTDALKAMLAKEPDISFCDSEEGADVIILNSCSVKGSTQEKIIYKARQLVSSGKKIIIAGCLATAARAVVEKEVPQASIVGTFSYGNLADAIRQTAAGKRVVLIRKEKELPLNVSVDKVFARVQICKGCMSNCSYCSTKLARGKLESYKPEEIVLAVESAIQRGAKEIQLCAQDTACYGFDLEDGTDLAGLVEKISTIPGRFRIRIGMGNPEHFEKIKEKMASALQDEKVYKFLHIPVQAGSDRVLSEMKRDYSAGDFESLLKFFRGKVPKITIETDIIVGFPSETAEEFLMTMGLLKRSRPEITNVSKYSQRPNTPAAALPQLDRAEMNRRSEECSALCRKITLESNEAMIGQEGIALVTERKGDGWLARMENYKPFLAKDAAEGQFLKVIITGAGQSHLSGTLLN